MTLVGTFFALLAPALEPQALRIALQATYALLAAVTVALLVITTCASSLRNRTPHQRLVVPVPQWNIKKQHVWGSTSQRCCIQEGNRCLCVCTVIVPVTLSE